MIRFVRHLLLFGLCAGFCRASTAVVEVVEAPLRGPHLERFAAVGWVNPAYQGIAAYATTRSVGEDPAVLFYAPDNQPGELVALGSTIDHLEPMWGSLTNWHGVSFWVQGGGQPADALLRWGMHTYRFPVDDFRWRKIHIPWSYWLPRINPASAPVGPISLTLTRHNRTPTYTVVCVDPLTPEQPQGRDWNQARPGEAQGIFPAQGILLEAETLNMASSTGISFYAKHEGRSVYGTIGWVGALDHARPFLVASNHWQHFTLPWEALPRPDRDPPLLRISMDPVLIPGVWMVMDRLRLYRGVADEMVDPPDRPEPSPVYEAAVWNQRTELLEPLRKRLAKPGAAPRIVVLSDLTMLGDAMSYLRMSPQGMLEQGAYRRLAGDLGRHFRLRRVAVEQAVFSEAQNAYLPVTDSTDPYNIGLRLHILHANGIANLLRSGAVEIAAKHRPDLIILQIGNTDLAATELDDYQRQLEDLVARLKRLSVPLLLVSPVPVLDTRPPTGFGDSSYLRRVLAFRERCAELAERENLPFTDVSSALLCRGIAFAGGYYATVQQLNHQGHLLLSRLLFSQITGLPRRLWHDLPPPVEFRMPHQNVENAIAAMKGVDIFADEYAKRWNPRLEYEQSRFAYKHVQEARQFISEISGDMFLLTQRLPEIEPERNPLPPPPRDVINTP